MTAALIAFGAACAALLTIIALVRVVGRAVRWLDRLALIVETDFDAKLDHKLDPIVKELHPNNGSSFRDMIERRFDGVDGRFDVVEVRFDGLNRRVDRLEDRDGLGHRVDRLEDREEDRKT